MRIVLFLLIGLICHQVFSQNDLEIVSIGDFKTTKGEIIKDCRIAYRTLGKLNDDKSNVILWLTVFSGRSENPARYYIPKFIDINKYYVVIVEALGNGVSSSPSNTKYFPTISIRDMVNSQYELLVKNLNINHVEVVGGISMGGMQALEWAVSYPDFMDNAISIAGTPKQSFFDLLFWNTELEIIKYAERSGKKEDKEQARKRVADIGLLHLFTPTYFAKNKVPADLKMVSEQEYTNVKNISNMRSQIEAMMAHDIYISAGKTIYNIKERLGAELLLIVSLQDQMVNPQNSIELAEQIGCKIETIDTECGHGFIGCGTGTEKTSEIIGLFLKDK